MRLNKYRPHLLVLPEDDANRQIANGFILHPNVNSRAIQVLPPSGGWRKVLEDFRNVHAPPDFVKLRGALTSKLPYAC